MFFPRTRWIERFAQASQKSLTRVRCRAAVRNLRTNPELRDRERVKEPDALSARKSSARHVDETMQCLPRRALIPATYGRR